MQSGHRWKASEVLELLQTMIMICHVLCDEAAKLLGVCFVNMMVWQLSTELKRHMMSSGPFHGSLV
jgi:hypothetical protein